MGLMPLKRSSIPGSSSSSSTTVPLPLVVSLCLACFLVGYVSRRSPAGIDSLPSIEVTAAPRKLQAQDLSSSNPQSHNIQAPQTIRPPLMIHPPTEGAPPGELPEHGNFSQTFLEQSGLLQLRPPLQPAQSGNDFYTLVPYQILSWYPRILVFPNFIDAPRASHIIALAEKRMAPSGLSWRKGEEADAQQQIRTSSGVFLARSDDPDGVLAWLEEKIASVTLLPPTHGEAFNVLRYELNQKYDSHMDTFDPKDFGPQYSQRMATMLLYLSEVEEGGETVFKREGRDGANRPVTDWASCEPSEFKYKPRMGDAVLFYSMDPDLNINARALHGGCPVRAGRKWVATKWLHEKPLRNPEFGAD